MPGNFAGLIFLALVLVAAIFYAFDTSPLFQIEANSDHNVVQPLGLDNQSIQFGGPAFIILGEYNGELYTFNQGVKKVYAYNFLDSKERQISKLLEFDTFWWHTSGKVLVLSDVNNTLGNLYLLNLATASPQPVLITDRESGPLFPRTLSVKTSLPLAWASGGDAFAFVAKDTQRNTESLFIFEVKDNQLIYTPARNLELISSIIWVDGDKRLALIAISDGQENRYFVDRLGGQFSVWNVID